MPSIAVVGAQWGDEGKGRVIDYLAEEADVIVRYQGGDNAGHTVVFDDETFKIHTLPCGIVREGKGCVVGPGVVVWLPTALNELVLSERKGSTVWIDESAPIILPIHRALDAARELASGKDLIGTTKRGIGPVYSDFWLRRGLRMGDLSSKAKVESVLKTSGYFDELVSVMEYLKQYGSVNFLDLGFNIDPCSFEETVQWVMCQAERFVSRLCDTRMFVHDCLSDNQRVLFEGAQAELLDGYNGDRRNRTSSLCGKSGIAASFGVHNIDRVIGVAKAYLTRVGSGPFPTEQVNSLGDNLRTVGGEYGATTGRPRRCGWLDVVALQYAARMGGFTELAVTKLDVLTGQKKIPVCTRYRVEEGVIHLGRPVQPGFVKSTKTLTGELMGFVKPVYTQFSGWDEDITSVRTFEDLPREAQFYLNSIEGNLGLPISHVSVGAERDAIIKCV